MSSSTSVYPKNAIVRITDVIGGVTYQGSGVLIAPDEVLTATHMVYQTGVGTATNIKVSPGYENGATPYGTISGVSFHYNALNDSNGVISNSASQNDFAVIHLAQPVTNAGTMALGANYGGGAATVSGYPASANGGQVDQAEAVYRDPFYNLFEGIALGPGSSGGPVWTIGPNGKPQVVGLVSSGSGQLGYFLQLTSADDAAIMAWVAADEGAQVAAASVTETIPGPGGTTISIAVAPAIAAITQATLAQIIAAGTANTLYVSQTQAATVSAGYSAVVDTATAASTLVLSAGANLDVLATGGPLTVLAGGAAGTLVGGASGALFAGATNTGRWNIAFAGGANTIVAAGGSTTVAAGSGQNMIMLGSGTSSVSSTGSDTIVGGAGAATISAAANNALVFAGAGALSFWAGSGSSTLIGGSGGTALLGGSGATLFFGSGASDYQGGGAADTVVGGNGTLSGNGGGGAVLMFGGAAGNNNLISGGGAATLVGAAAGDVLSATGAAPNNGNVMLIAGAGAETVRGTGASGNIMFFGGSGPDVMMGGAGNNIFVTGTGNETLTGGGALNAFVFVNGVGSGTDIITDFNPQRDVIFLEGFDSALALSSVTNQTVSGAGTVIALPDGLKINFNGVPNLSQNVFQF